MRNLQEQVKKAFCYQKMVWPFSVRINCSSDLKNFANCRPSASNFNFFSQSLEHIFLTVGQNNFSNKIPFLLLDYGIFSLFWFQVFAFESSTQRSIAVMELQSSSCRFAHTATMRICVRSQWSRIENLIWKISKTRALKDIKFDIFF